MLCVGENWGEGGREGVESQGDAVEGEGCVRCVCVNCVCVCMCGLLP